MIRDSLIILIASVHPSNWVIIKLPYYILTSTYHKFKFHSIIMAPPVHTILTRYSSNASFTTLLTNLGIDGNERDQFAMDGFNNMSLLVKHLSYDIGSFKSHLRNLNKTFANAPNARRMYFNPICTNRLLGVLYYFT